MLGSAITSSERVLHQLQDLNPIKNPRNILQLQQEVTHKNEDKKPLAGFGFKELRFKYSIYGQKSRQQIEETRNVRDKTTWSKILCFNHTQRTEIK